MIRLKITKAGNLLSVLHDQEVTPAQVSIVMAMLKAPELTYGEVLSFLALRRVKDLEAPGVLTGLADSPAGAGEEVEAFRG